MAITHSTAARDVIVDAVLALLDVDGPGFVEFQTSGAAEVATLTFSATAFGASSAGTATANAIAPDTNATGGDVAQFELQDGNGVGVIFGDVTVTGDGGDIELSSLNIGPGDTVAITSLTYTAPV